MHRRGQRFWLLYVSWIVLCGGLFLAFSDMEDPSRPRGRILSIHAGHMALESLRAHDPARFAAWEVVHVARARRGEGGGQDRWVVLLDRVPHTRLREAVVIEMGLEDGRVIAIRKPR